MKADQTFDAFLFSLAVYECAILLVMTEDEYEKTFPVLDLIYPIAVNSYEVSGKRLDSIDNRLQTALAFIVSVSAAVPAIGFSGKLQFRSTWLLFALISFILSIFIGIFARWTGETILLSPETLLNEYKDDKPYQFKNFFIQGAAKDFEKNMNLVYRKWKLSVAVIILFALEAVCLALWAAQQ